MRDDYLFAELDLRLALEAQQKKMEQEIDGIPAERLLNTTADSWVGYFKERYRLAAPILDESGITTDQSEAQVDVSRDPTRYIRDPSRPFYIAGAEVKVFVPFEGEEDLFKCQPSAYTLNPPQGTVQDRELVLSYTRLDHDPAKLKSEIDRDLGRIKQYLETVMRDVTPFNDSIPQLVKGRIERRREKLLRDQNLVTSLGFAVRRRPEAPETFVVPTVRRKVPEVQPPKGKASTPPEPTLAMDEYEHILRVISNMVA
jgi:hypothetical protein